MAIDTSKIPGFDALTEEQKAAINGLTPDLSGYVKKDLYDKTASDLAAMKKQHNAMLSEDEQKKQAAAEEHQKLLDRIAELENREATAKHRASYLSMGYDEASASKAAEALVKGDLDTVFAVQKQVLDAHDKALKAEQMKNTPTPPAGTPATGTDYAKQIAEARSRGDYTAMAALMRQEQEEKQKG